MNAPIQNPSNTNLVLAIEQNAINCVRDWGRWHEMRFHDEPRLTWFESGIRFPIFNGILRARVDAQEIDAIISDMLGRFQDANVPMIWWIGPSTEPSDLGKRLEDRGFRCIGQAVGMAMDLEDLRVSSPSPDRDLQVDLVRNREDLRVACDIVSTVNDFPKLAAEKWYEMHAALGLDGKQPWRHYLARLQGKPVGTASLFLGTEVASIVSVSTLPEARGRGVGSAVSVKPFQDAHQIGYRIATLCSSEMGQGVYRRIGFQDYCTLGMYVWM